MTFPCKEEFREFEMLAATQGRIAGVANVHGIRLDQFDSKRYRPVLLALIKFYRDRRYSYKSYDLGHTKTVSFFIPIELDEGMEAGYRFAVTRIRDSNIPGGGFVTITIKNDRRKILTH